MTEILESEVRDAARQCEIELDPEQLSAIREEIAAARPAIVADGGDIDLVAVTGDIVRVRLTGACTLLFLLLGADIAPGGQPEAVLADAVNGHRRAEARNVAVGPVAILGRAPPVGHGLAAPAVGATSYTPFAVDNSACRSTSAVAPSARSGG
jgi:hypothetical protein